MKRLSMLFAILALAVVAVGQTTAPGTDQTPAPTTSYFVGAGAGFSRSSTPPVMGWLAAGGCIEKTGTCPYTEWDNITGKTTTMQGGVLQRLAVSGNLSLLALAEIGGATTAGATSTVSGVAPTSSFTAVFSGGFLLKYGPPKWNGISIVLPVKVVKINGQDVTLAVGLGIAKKF
jgi:hypothetical protein